MSKCDKVVREIPAQLLRRPVNRVVIYEETEIPVRGGHIGTLGSAFGAQIRVCSRPMTGACTPGVCDCPPEQCKLGGAELRKQQLLRLAKLGLFLAAVKWTVDQGFWSDAQKTADITLRYRRVLEEVFWTRTIRQRSPEEMYDMARREYNIKNVWNGIISSLLEFIGSVPTWMGLGFAMVGNAIYKKEEPELDKKGKKKAKKTDKDKKNKDIDKKNKDIDKKVKDIKKKVDKKDKKKDDKDKKK